MRRRGGRKRAIGTRAPMVVSLRPNARWSLDFVHDQFACGRRFRILTIVDDCTRECLGLVADTSLSGLRVARELDRLIAERGKPGMIVSDNVLSQERRRESRQYASVHASMGLRDLFCQLLRTRTSLNSTPLATFTLQAASTGEGSSRP